MTGKVCGRGCFRGICWEHTGRQSHTVCSKCGRGTRSAKGICASVACRAARQGYTVTDGPPAAPAAKVIIVKSSEVEAYVDELLEGGAAPEGVAVA